ncbi:MAG TPA: hypothetical protein VM492_09275, partial [Sumerlaeia bacterium]|nr:hypothetical protein [Sumerlaeia bacterium]
METEPQDASSEPTPAGTAPSAGSGSCPSANGRSGGAVAPRREAAARGVGPGAPPPLNRAVFVALLLAAGFVALAFRVPRLDLRPMHCDEAVHAVKAGIFLDTGVYK